MKKIIGILALMMLSCTAVFTGCSEEDKLAKVYESVAKKHSGSLAMVCLTIADDASYLQFDSNPYDSDDYTVSGAWDILDSLKEELEVPSYIEAEMGNTTWSMGKQTAEFDDYILTWTYHPDKGLEIMCRVK